MDNFRRRPAANEIGAQSSGETSAERLSRRLATASSERRPAGTSPDASLRMQQRLENSRHLEIAATNFSNSLSAIERPDQYKALINMTIKSLEQYPEAQAQFRRRLIEEITKYYGRHSGQDRFSKGNGMIRHSEHVAHLSLVPNFPVQYLDSLGAIASKLSEQESRSRGSAAVA